MRPTVSETIAGIRRILLDVVGPELRSDFAKVTFERCLTDLGEVEARWHQVVPQLRVEVDELSAALDTVDDGAPLAGDIAARVRRTLADDPIAATPYPSFDELGARYEELRGLAADVLDSVDRAGVDLQPVHAELRAYLRRAVSRGVGA